MTNIRNSLLLKAGGNAAGTSKQINIARQSEISFAPAAKRARVEDEPIDVIDLI